MSLALLALFPLALYLSFTLPRLHYPGLHTDEAMTTLPILSLLGHNGAGGDIYLTPRSMSFPLAMGQYHGALESYLVAPFIYAMGTTPEALRLPMILFGGLTLILFLRFLLLLTGNLALAWLGTMLLALHPTFVTGTRMGMYYGAFQPFCVSASFLFFLAWRRKGKPGHFYAACFILGAGAGARSWFLAHVAAVAVAGAVFLSRDRIFKSESAAKIGGRTLALAGIFFLIPVAPFLLFLVRHSGYTALIIRQAWNTPEHSYLLEIGERIAQVKQILGGDAFLGEVFPAGNYRCRFYWLLWSFSLLWCVLTLPFSKFRSTRIKKAFFLTYSGAFLAVSPFSPSNLKALHLFQFLPVAILMIVFAVEDLLGALPSRYSWWICAPLAGLCLFINPPEIQACLKRGMETGVLYSAAIYDLADWLTENRYFDVAEVEPGVGCSLIYLTGGKAAVAELFDERIKADGGFPLEQAVGNPRTIYVEYLWDEDISRHPDYNRHEIFLSKIKKLHRRICVVRTFPSAARGRSPRLAAAIVLGP